MDGLDLRWLAHVVGSCGPVPTAAMRWVSVVGDPADLLAGSGVVGAMLLWHRRAEATLLLARSVAGTLLLTVVACLGAMTLAPGDVARPRGSRVERWAVVGAAATAVGFSPVYLAAHWPTDVFLGRMTGAGSLATCAAATRALIPARSGPAGPPGGQAAGWGLTRWPAARPPPRRPVTVGGGDALGRDGGRPWRAPAGPSRAGHRHGLGGPGRRLLSRRLLPGRQAGALNTCSPSAGSPAEGWTSPSPATSPRSRGAPRSSSSPCRPPSSPGRSSACRSSLAAGSSCSADRRSCRPPSTRRVGEPTRRHTRRARRPGHQRGRRPRQQA